MSKDWYKDMLDFHKVVMLDKFETYPNIPTNKHKKLRKILIREEVEETLQAIDNNNLEKVADGITDSIVVLLGTAIAYGIDIRPVWDEVHKTNMAKAKGKMREDGKRLKPTNWVPPDIMSILERQGRKK